MKKLLFGGYLTILNIVAYSQVPNCSNPPTYSQLTSNIIKQLDKSQISTGILYDVVVPWSSLETFNGSSSADTSNGSHFMQAYTDLYTSSFNHSNMIHSSDLEDQVYYYHSDRVFHHPVGIIDYAFNTLRQDAVSNNLLYLSNNQLFDTPGRTSSPYLNKTASIAAPLVTSKADIFKTGTHYLHFSSTFVKSNTGFTLNQVSNIEVQQNGVTIVYNNVSGLENFVIPTYIPNVSNVITYKIIMQVAGVQKVFYFKIDSQEEALVTPCNGLDIVDVESDAYDFGYFKGAEIAKGRATIYYADQNCATKRITKPIIFVDGFDPGNKQDAAAVWKQYLNFPFKEGGIDVELGTELRAAGYDLIIYDERPVDENNDYNSGGTGLVENNAMALVKFLETFYAQHASTIQEDFVVIGGSMGGLVTRYALTYMEKNNKPHHTRLFVSFDSPQNGAQIPLGLQQLLDCFTQHYGVKLIKKMRYALHQSDAAKQMLLHHSSTDSETPQPHAYRQKFLNNLDEIGNWPTQCRMISISDGNRYGIKKTVDPDGGLPTPAIQACDKELSLRLIKWDNPYFATYLKTRMYAQTESARCKSFELAAISNNILFALASSMLPLTFSRKYSQSTANMSLDIAPGSRMGKDPLGKIAAFEDIIKAAAGKIYVDSNIVLYNSFIPTISSVAYTFPNNEFFNYYKDFTGVNLSKCAGTTPFDTVYAGGTDLKHVEINSVIANAFRSEVYYPKPKSVCAGDCPEYLTLNAPLTSGNYQYKASKSITLAPNFKADGQQPLVMKADIGCPNTLTLSLPQPEKNKNSTTTTSTCGSFTWDQSRNNCVRNGSTVTFQVFVTNMDISAYAEFSIDGTNYFKATILDDGWQVTVPYISGGNQLFWARASDKRSNTIFGSLGHCN